MEQEDHIIADKIKNFRKAKKMSQKELSERSGINLSIIKKYETGYRNPKPDQLEKIAAALEISSTELLPINISNVNDILSLLMKIDEHTDLDWNIKKDEADNYIPGTLTISFKEKKIEDALVDYMDYKKEFTSKNIENTDIQSSSYSEKIRLCNKYQVSLQNLKQN